MSDVVYEADPRPPKPPRHRCNETIGMRGLHLGSIVRCDGHFAVRKRDPVWENRLVWRRVRWWHFGARRRIRRAYRDLARS